MRSNISSFPFTEPIDESDVNRRKRHNGDTDADNTFLEKQFFYMLAAIPSSATVDLLHTVEKVQTTAKAV